MTPTTREDDDMKIDKSEAKNHLCPYNRFEPCHGVKCMAFVLAERPYEECETDNLVETTGPDGVVMRAPIGAVKSPEGGGWEAHGQPFHKSYEKRQKLNLPHATAQRWRRPREIADGYCGRVNEPHHFDW